MITNAILQQMTGAVSFRRLLSSGLLRKPTDRAYGESQETAWGMSLPNGCRSCRIGTEADWLPRLTRLAIDCRLSRLDIDRLQDAGALLHAVYLSLLEGIDPWQVGNPVVVDQRSQTWTMLLTR